MITPKDNRKSLDDKDRPWNWQKEKWDEHADLCFKLMGFRPEQPTKPDDEMMVMLNNGFNVPEIIYLRDIKPSDRERLNAYLPSVNQAKKIYAKD